jgi:hypothetical protein
MRLAPTAVDDSLRLMDTALVYAIVAAIVVGVLSWALAKPRSLAGRWLRHAWWWLFVRTSQEHDEALNKRVDEIHEALNDKIGALEVSITKRLDTVERAVIRISTELAQRQCSEEGNPDDEYYSDWYRWFSGDPDANVDYSRKQERDLARLRNGDFRVKR